MDDDDGGEKDDGGVYVHCPVARPVSRCLTLNIQCVFFVDEDDDKYKRSMTIMMMMRKSRMKVVCMSSCTVCFTQSHPPLSALRLTSGQIFIQYSVMMMRKTMMTNMCDDDDDDIELLHSHSLSVAIFVFTFEMTFILALSLTSLVSW